MCVVAIAPNTRRPDYILPWSWCIHVRHWRWYSPRVHAVYETRTCHTENSHIFNNTLQVSKGEVRQSLTLTILGMNLL